MGGLGYALLLASSAGAQTLASGELFGHRAGWAGNAYTMPRGSYTVSPLSRSAVGVSERVDVKVPLVGTVLGPKVSTEIGLVSREGLAISVEPLVWFWTWGSLQEVGATGRATAKAGPGYLTGALTYAQVSPLLREEQSTDLRVEANYELMLSDKSRLIVSGRTNLASTGLIDTVGGLYFASASESVGMSVGVNVGYVDLSEAQRVTGIFGLGDGIPGGTVLPMPHLQLWIRG